jgi:hypothetical protein
VCAEWSFTVSDLLTTMWHNGLIGVFDSNAGCTTDLEYCSISGGFAASTVVLAAVRIPGENTHEEQLRDHLQ